MNDENKTPADEAVNSEAVKKAEETADAIPADDGADKDKKKKKEIKRLEGELDKTVKELEKLKAELAENNDKYMRMLAEYDNFRRRSQKEREGIYADAYGDAIKEVLPVLDNLERAVQFSDAEAVLKGVKMTLKSLTDMLTKLGITEIEAVTFDPALHNAVMHVEDETKGEGEIVDVLQKGYKKGDKIIRYAMVKVAN